MDENQDDEDELDGEITDQARELRRLEQFQQDITRLQLERDQLMHQATALNRANQTQRAIRQAKSQRERLLREI